MQIGLIAGTGGLPEIVIADAHRRGYSVLTVALKDLADPKIESVSEEIRWVSIGKIGEVISVLKKAGLSEVVFAGKVPKSLLYKSRIVPDMRAMKILMSLKDRRDDSILGAIEGELLGEGIRLRDIASFSPHLMTPEGVFAGRSPSREEWRDIEFGWKMAKEIGRLDIGQTVVVKDRAVMAVEAIEGTDEAILRGGHWAGEGVVVVKVSRPQQSMKLDVPVAGIDTIKAIGQVRGRVLALEADRSIILDREAIAAEADRAGITVLGYSGPATGV